MFRTQYSMSGSLVSFRCSDDVGPANTLSVVLVPAAPLPVAQQVTFSEGV